MGKNLGDDLREGKATLPLIMAMQLGTSAQRDTIREAIENGAVAELNAVVEIVRQTGALDATLSAASHEAQRAIAAAQELPANCYADGLIQLARQLLERRH
jgi:octaprenyl-diphosphate synthase